MYFMNQSTKITNDDSLILSKRQSSIAAAALIFLLFFVFVMGYFLGTKHATDEFVAQINQETFADQIFASVHSLSQQKDTTPIVESSALDATTLTSLASKPEEVVEDAGTHYAAELIGYATEKAAKQFIDRVARDSHIDLELRTRTNVKHRGKQTVWYQVVTPKFKSEKELEAAITCITKTEKLHDIKRGIRL